MTHKTLSRVEIKDADKGEIRAVFSTLNVIDKDGDVTLPGAFTDGAPVVISAYGHRSWQGALPVGKGVIRAGDDEAVLEGVFLLSTTHGRDTFETVKEMSEAGLQEWSYSLEDVTAERGEHDGQDVRFIKSVKVKEVSPVLVGAGVNTRTLAVKSADLKFSEHVEAVLADLDVLAARARDVVALRAEKGKTICEESVDLLKRVAAGVDAFRSLIVELTPNHAADFARWKANVSAMSAQEGTS